MPSFSFDLWQCLIITAKAGKPPHSSKNIPLKQNRLRSSEKRRAGNVGLRTPPC